MTPRIMRLTAMMYGLAMATAGFAGIILDGKSDDWDLLPVLIQDRDNLPNVFPEGVPGVYSDRVDVKEVKALVVGNNLYVYMKFWGGPIWPNQAYRQIKAA